jgi:hypothetical protein
MKKTILILGIIALLMGGCGQATKKQTEKEVYLETTITDVDSIAYIEKSTEKEERIELDFLKNLRMVELPYKEFTNFDNHVDVRKMSASEIRQLKLKSKIPDGSDFSLNYQIHLSDNFHAIAVSYQLGDHELFTTLITYDNEYNIIDLLNVAYDEIAESWFWRSSTIYKDHIVVEKVEGIVDDEQIVSKTRYKIESNGTFIKKQ